MVALLGLEAGTAGGANFAVPYSPTGIAYDASSNRVCVASGNNVYIYDTNGVQQSSFSPATGIFDLGGGTGGNVWVGNGTSVDNRYYNGSGIDAFSIPSDTVAVGRELAVGGTNYVLYAVSGGNVVARALAPSAPNDVVLLPTPAGTTGGDWALRPGGYALDHVIVALGNLTTVNTFSSDGTNGFQLYQSFTIESSKGSGYDVSFGNDEIWVAQGLNPILGNAVTYPFVLPAVPAAAVSVVGTNGSAAVSWSGRWLEASADLAHWQVVSSAPQPYLPPLTNPATFFRAVK
ncbi:MAG: hypothetical protein NTZ16_07800 [Verrucomicrobia bacterium]|nr:hypothetical protein [Verrucomicrobiota bacterium]